MRKMSHLSARTRTVVELLAAKRDGAELATDEIKSLVAGLVAGTVADYQFSAFLMAVFLRGMTDQETVALTEAMLHSGRVLNLTEVPGVKVDKHSTGGVGDKTSIALAPLVAACGVPVPMVSGRGLGHTGGTLDKLEAIPGFRTDLSTEDFRKTVREIGTSMIGQTADIAPADKRIYALRDVTATVECIPLIVASILSKKLAEGIDALVLDVKVGSGAFMKNMDHARALALALVAVGKRAGKDVRAILTQMDNPLGNAIGNANETSEAIDILKGTAPFDVTECTLVLAEEMLTAGKVAATREQARARLNRAIADGSALRKLETMIERHGGNPRVCQDASIMPQPDVSVPVLAASEGYVIGIDAFALGILGVSLGAGRTRADQKVDHAVGFNLYKKPGEAVTKGEPLAMMLLRSQHDPSATAERVLGAYKIGSKAEADAAQKPLVLDRI
jgi:pyrimidine-nucleoside phosphorylase